MGQVWLAALQQQGHELQGWLRVPQATCQVNVIDVDSGHQQFSLPANNQEFLATSDLLLVTLKAWQVSDAVKALAGTFPATRPILLIHNGMGTVEELLTLRHPLLISTTTQAARRDGGTIIHVANGTTHIGPGNEAGKAWSTLAEVLQFALPDIAWHDDIQSAVWKKLAVNCVINPLTALYNCPNGELVNHHQEVADICHEVAMVMAREGHHTSPEGLLFYVDQVITSTAANISSMLQDIRVQRHTEIDYITGYLLQRARAYGIAVPVNTRLYDLIKRKESEYERISTDLSGPWE